MTDIDDQPDPINWRTTGRKPVGSLVKGSVTIPSSIPSVPTKYITILNPDCHEKKGFLHQAVRFPAPPYGQSIGNTL
ncbi:MAG: hypothetical protein EZS28_033772 [Streblomastix strix]|uniref:Uncharacterized protein n=1 Tax=Streblomastix strix TaxID=222440 RepID=A0A5J4UL18_9EUKA|nr:MAG: hypothetical protein EZS28_033772 [Streblomastix strix]